MLAPNKRITHPVGNYVKRGPEAYIKTLRVARRKESGSPPVDTTGYRPRPDMEFQLVLRRYPPYLYRNTTDPHSYEYVVEVRLNLLNVVGELASRFPPVLNMGRTADDFRPHAIGMFRPGWNG